MKNRIIIGDIHSCATELKAIIEHFPDCEYIAVGDLFDRGRKGMEVWDLIHEFDIKACLGNHELKLLNYLTGKRNWLPRHYQVFLADFRNRFEDEKLIKYLESLPLTIKLDDKALVAHGGIAMDDPWREDVSSNVYGAFDPNLKMPRGDASGAWWNKYDGDVLVYYGHITFPEIKICRNSKGMLNSIGLDTGACHGQKLSAICYETGACFSVESERDYFGELSAELKLK